MKNTAKLIIFLDKTSFPVLIVKSCLIIRFFRSKYLDNTNICSIFASS